MKTRPLLLIIAVLALIVLGYLAFSAANREAEPAFKATSGTVATTSNPAATTTSPQVPSPAPAASTASAITVAYGPNGFTPSNVTVPVGSTVTFVNQGADRMWVGVDEHPTHTQYDGTTTQEHCANGPTAQVFDQCGAGSSYSFVFTKAGAFEYHNHARASHGGTVSVTAR